MNDANVCNKERQEIMEPQCVFCDDDDPGGNLRTPKAGIEKIKHYGRLFPNSKVAYLLNTIPEDQIRIHVGCQKNVGNGVRNALRDSPTEEPLAKMKRRSDEPPFIGSRHCLLCGDNATEDSAERHPDRDHYAISYPTMVDINDLIKICNRPDRIDLNVIHTVRGRLMAITDLHAERIRYHRGCYRNFCREEEQVVPDEAPLKRNSVGRPVSEEKRVSFDKLCEWLEKSADQHTVSELHYKMIEIAGSRENTYTSNQYLKQNLLRRYGNKISFSEVDGKPDVMFFNAIEPAVTEAPVLNESSVSAEIELFERVAKIFRKDILNRKQTFDGKFKPGCEEKSVSRNLVLFMSMIIDGPSLLVDESGTVDEKALNKILLGSASDSIVLSLSQQIAFNTVDKRKICGKYVRHSKDRTTPFPLYIGIKMYLQTTKITIDMLASRGISVSYSALKGLSVKIANSVIKHWDENGIVVPPQAMKGIFTIIGFDNIDWAAKSTLSKSVSTLHGTIIVVHQFSDRISMEGGHQNVNILEKDEGSQTVRPLPEDYFAIDEQYSISEDDRLNIPPSTTPVKPPDVNIPQFLLNESLWLEHASALLTKNALEKNDWVSWAAYHASVQADTSRMVTQLCSHVMPILLEKASDPSTVAHVFRIACQLTNYLNPGQIVVVETDCPLYQTGKKLQFKYPNEIFSEDKLFLSLGSLHIEKMLWQMSGEFQDGSGITTAFANSGIDTVTVGSYLLCANITKTRYHKQVLVLALEVLKRRAYRSYLDYESENGEDLLFGPKHSYQSWLTQIRAEQPQAEYFSTCQEIDLSVLEVVRACRMADLDNLVLALTAVMPYVLKLDHLNYSRNLPVFLRDLLNMKERHPQLYHELKENGNFMGRKTKNKFSSMPIDQATEQAICWLKHSGGVIGNLDDPQTVRRHQVALPEMARICREFEGSDKDATDDHHEMFPKLQRDFKNNVNALVDAIEKLGNPWMEKSGLLYELNESIVMPDVVVQNIRSMRQSGEVQFQAILDLRINSQVEAYTDTISRNNLMLFRKALDSKVPTQTVKAVVSERKKQQARVVDIITAHQAGRCITALSRESSCNPPSLTKDGHMHHGNKADIVDCITTDKHKHRNRPNATCTIIDGTALIRKMKPGLATTIKEYIDNILSPNILSHFSYASRVDLVFDRYFQNSVKNATRDGRGTGKRRKVGLDIKIPTNWKEFLSCAENKKELFPLVSRRLVETSQLPPGKVLLMTENERCISTDDMDLEFLSPSNHEEADTRMFLHLFGAVICGHKKVLIIANDSDIVVLGVRAFALISSLDELWIAYSMGANRRYVAIHEVVASIGQTRSLGLPGFHAFTGCDTTSSFFGKGKKSAYSVWLSHSKFDCAFSEMSNRQPGENSIRTVYPLIQQFVSILYGADGTSDVDETRLDFLLHKGKDFDNMPPSSDALYQHTLRSVYQSGYIWGSMFDAALEEVYVENWGRKKVGGINSSSIPRYTTLPIISRDLRELSVCKCTTGKCSGNCGCKKGEPPQPCTSLCGCKGKCKKT